MPDSPFEVYGTTARPVFLRASAIGSLVVVQGPDSSVNSKMALVSCSSTFFNKRIACGKQTTPTLTINPSRKRSSAIGSNDGSDANRAVYADLQFAHCSNGVRNKRGIKEDTEIQGT